MSDKPEVVAKITNKYGDPEGFAERELKAVADIQNERIGTELIRLSDHEAARAADKARIAELERDVEAKLKIMVELSENVAGKGDFIAGLIDALQKISEWPDGGDRYGQDNIINFAKTALAQQESER